jgi:hypothetical protein
MQEIEPRRSSMSKSNRRRVTTTLISLAAGMCALALFLGRDPTGSALPRPVSVQPEPTPVQHLVLRSGSGATGNEAPRVIRVEPASPVQKVVETSAPPPKPPSVEVVFVLDTTGSMDGLIEGAKRKIWSIANQIQRGQPKPEVRIGLVGYRDLGDAYVTRTYGLSEDMEDVYAHLRRFRADGGGDTPEHVNRALADAIRKMQWREGSNVLKLIFLVGDAPPHDGREGLYTRDLTREAAEKGITINTVRCGDAEDTERSWRTIASTTGGMFTSIRQDGAMVATATPHDRRLAELNARLSATALPSGSASEKREVSARLSVNAGMDTAAQAESATFRARSGRLDSKDLLTKMKSGKKLDSMKDEELPAPVAALPAAKRAEYVANVEKERDKLRQEIEVVSKDREAYMRSKSKARPKAFDDTVGDALKAQGKKVNVAY